MRCFEKNIAPDVFGDVLEKVKHRTNDASNAVSRPALNQRASKFLSNSMKLNQDIPNSEMAVNL